jgi:DNA-binding MarR family transcriptional regulator
LVDDPELASGPLSRRIVAGLGKIALVLRSRAWKGAGAAGVTPTQADMLRLLDESAQGLRLSNLAKLLGISAPTASDSINALVAKGLVAKEPGSDRRSVSLKPTARGTEVAAQVSDWPDFLARAVDTLPAAEQGALLRALLKVLRALQESNDIRPQRMCVTCRYFRPYVHAEGPHPHHCDLVGAAFGDRALRLDCPEQEEAPLEQRDAAWQRFSLGPIEAGASR